MENVLQVHNFPKYIIEFIMDLQYISSFGNQVKYS